MKIENVLPALGGNMNFENVMYESTSGEHNFFSLRCFTGYSLSKIMKIRWMVVLGRPGGMRGGAGGRFEGV